MPEVGEVRTAGDETRRWNGQGWELIAVQEAQPEPAAPVQDPRLNPERMSFRGASSMMTSEPQREGMTPLEGAVTAAGGTAALGALTGGAGVLPTVARAAVSPAGQAVIGGVNALRKGEGPLGIAYEAAEGAALGTVAIPFLPKFLKAKLAHTLARGAKVAAEKAVPAVAKAAAPVAKSAVKEAAKAATPTVEDVSVRALKLIESKLSPGQVAEVLRSEFAPGARGIGVGYFRRLTDQLIAHAAKGAK